MQGIRITILLLIFSATAVALAGIRIEQARCGARIQQLKLRQVALAQRLHEQQLQIARLRSPEQIKNRIDRLNLSVYTPEQWQSHDQWLDQEVVASARY